MVLLVEHERVVANDLERTLAALGYDVTASVASAAAAIHAAETRRPDLVLMDVHVNGLQDGVEAARVLRTRFELPIVFVTDSADAGTVGRVGPIEPYGYLVKPIRTDDLRVAVDIALHKHDVESRLRDSERRLMAVLESAGEGIVIADEQGTCVVFNATAERILGIGATDALPTEWAERYGVFADDKVTPVPAHELPLVRALRGESSDGVELFVRNAKVPEGVFVSLTGRPLRDARGDLRGGVVTFSDVTEKRAQSEALRVRDEMLMRSQKVEAVGRVAGGIAHDFSNVLTIVTAACERLQDQIAVSGQSGSREIDMILRNCERAASMVRQLLAFSRQQTLAPRPIDMGRLVGSAGELLHQLLGEQIQLEIEVAPGLHAVEADPGQIEQVLMNLAINARDAMPDGGTLRVRLQTVSIDEGYAQNHSPQPAGRYVLVTVSDTGHGMDKATKERAFEPFFTTKDAHHGSGLGLSTVYGIVKQSGGYVWIDSEPGEGTLISVYLPPTSAAPVEVDTPRPRTNRVVTQKTVLLTEDEDDVRELIQDMLASQGFEVLAARNPADAMARASSFEGTIDLLLTDVVMPGGSGRDLALEMKASRPAMKVLYISGYPEHGSAQGSVLEPGAPFLPKPFTRELLLRKIRDLLT